MADNTFGNRLGGRLNYEPQSVYKPSFGTFASGELSQSHQRLQVYRRNVLKEFRQNRHTTFPLGFTRTKKERRTLLSQYYLDLRRMSFTFYLNR